MSTSSVPLSIVHDDHGRDEQENHEEQVTKEANEQEDRSENIDEDFPTVDDNGELTRQD